MKIYGQSIQNWDDYSCILRQFKLDDLLKAIGIVSNQLLDSETGLPKGVKSASYFVTNSHGFRKKETVLINAWNLIDLSYHAIIATNDFRGHGIQSAEEVYALCDLEWTYHGLIEAPKLKLFTRSSDLLCYMVGMSGEQIKIQCPQKVFDNAARDMYILLELGEKRNKCKISSIIHEEVGVTWEILCASLFLAWVGYFKSTKIEDILSSIRWDESFSRADFEKVMDYYTTTYKEVRNEKIGRQIFYRRPYILSSKNERISINCFLNLFAYEHCILWTVRNNFLSQNDMSFVNLFGNLFEDYVADLFEQLLTKQQYKRLPIRENTKSADWIIRLGSYNFIIEQKSSIMKLGAKQQHSDNNLVAEYIVRTISKAITQLDETEKNLGDAEYIKVVLLYDDYLGDEIINDILKASEIESQKQNHYWFVDIGEFERLLMLYKSSPKDFDALVQEKIQGHIFEKPSRKGIFALLNEYSEAIDNSIMDKMLGYYRTYASEFINKRIRKQL